LRGIGFVALELAALAVGAFALSNITSRLWGWTGEHNAKAVQKLVYTAVTEKEMLWFDLQMGPAGDMRAAEVA
jgi:ATP-binding cassette, subfamily B (MDR/TAP), member 1